MFTNKHRFTTILTAACLGMFTIATLAGCGSTDNKSSVTPTVAVVAEATPTKVATPVAEATPATEAAPTAVATPIVEATPTAEMTPVVEAAPVAETTPTEEVTPAFTVAPVTEAVPTSEPTATVAPTEAPKVVIPENLPNVPKDQVKARIDRAIEENDTFTYVVTSVYREELSYFEPDANFCSQLKEFESLKDPDFYGVFMEDICYMDDHFRAKKHDYTLEDGTKVTFYVTDYGYALDYPDGKREYICTYDEDEKGQCIFKGYDYMDAHSCFAYDRNGNITMESFYYGESLDHFSEFAYDAKGYIISEKTTYMDGIYPGDDTYCLETCYEYDESDNLIAVIHRRNDSVTEKWDYTYHKDSDNRLTGWTLTKADDITEFFVKYYKDGSVAVYYKDGAALVDPEWSESDDRYLGMVFFPNEELRNNMATTSHLHPDHDDLVHDGYTPVVVYPVTDECEGMIDYEEASLLGIPTGTYAESETLIFCSGEISREQLDTDTFAFAGDDCWCAKKVVLKDGLLTSFVTGTYAGISYDYQYDAQKRLVGEKYRNFDVFKEVRYVYDENGRLIERVRDFKQILAGPEDTDLQYETTYRFTYDADGKLSGMTATTVDKTEAARTARESVLTLCR